MSELNRCPQCQAEIPGGAPEGLCPQCLLKAGLGQNSAVAEPGTTPFSPAMAFVPPAPAELQPAFPQLEILELLGKGGMGAVYKARQPKLDRLVAVKILPPEISRDAAFAERFNREARALAKLNHPNIVGVHDFGQADGYCYFIMEYVDGVNVRQAMRAGTLKAAEALKIVPQICDALQFAHDEGVVHRDIKPENILLDKKGRVKIADFGLAKLLGQTTQDVSLTGTRQVMGTLHYMAPEQLEGSKDVDHRADIYSLGVTFYEMLTGELPLGRFAPPSKKVEIDVRLDEVVLRSLEREPKQRYQHASEIKSEMDHIASGPERAPAKSAVSPPMDLEQAILDKNVPEAAEGGQEDLESPAAARQSSALWVTAMSILIFAAAFMPWGERRYTAAAGIYSHSESITGWNGYLNSERVKLPNWLVVIAAAGLTACFWLKARSIWQSPVVLLFALAGYGLCHVGCVLAYFMSFPTGTVGVGSFVTLVAFLIILGVILDETEGWDPIWQFLKPLVLDILGFFGLEENEGKEQKTASPPTPAQIAADRRPSYLRGVLFPILAVAGLLGGAYGLILAFAPERDLVIVATFISGRIETTTPDRYIAADIGGALAVLSLVVLHLVWFYRVSGSGVRQAIIVISAILTALTVFLILLLSGAYAFGIALLLIFGLSLSFGSLIAALFAGLAIWQEWWHADSTFFWKSLRTLLLAGSVLCLMLLVAFSMSGGSDHHARFEMGVPSRWLIFSTEPGEGFRINPLNWSLAVFVLGWLLFWFYKQSYVERKVVAREPLSWGWKALLAIGVGTWTMTSFVLFHVFWLPANVTISNGMKSGILDNEIWPYTGVGKSTVSLVPPVPIYAKLLIREDAEASRLGFHEGSFRVWEGNTGLTKLTYTLSVEPGPEFKPEPANDKDAPGALFIDALDNLSWRYKGADGKERSGILIDATPLAEWLRLSCPHAKVLDDKIVQNHAAVLADVIRDAAERLTGRPVLPTRSDNKLVSRLHHAAVHRQQSLQDTAFRSLDASSYNPTWTTEVPILWVGLPLTLTLWLGGLWLIFRVVRGNPVAA